jgi:shikimate dehydrogenase
MHSRYGLIGFPLSHSFSKKYFTEKFTREAIDSTYELFQIDSVHKINDIISNYQDLRGFNVTIPYKQQIIPLVNKLSDEAARIQAVNTVRVVRENGQIMLEGYNTDAPAFETELLAFMPKFPQYALILGTGGASAAVAYVLKKLNIEIQFVSRTPKQSSSSNNILSYEQLSNQLIDKVKLIINCTPVGMYPNSHLSPQIPYNILTPEHYLFDLVYNPEMTEFLKRGQEHGTQTRNGLGMLYKQADLAWNIWNR